MSAVLVVAGTDSSGGAGLARDVATLTALGVEALCAVTAVTAQTDAAVSAVMLMPAALVRAQIETALSGAPARAAKTGMLGGRDTIEVLAATLPPRDRLPLVIDPVLAATSGGALLDDAGRVALRALLLPRATLLTPNIPEAALLLGAAPAASPADILAQGRALCSLGAAAVLMKGGHGAGVLAIDYLVLANGAVSELSAPRHNGARRGTGCALASGIAAGLASGLALVEACARAKEHVTALWHAPA